MEVPRACLWGFTDTGCGIPKQNPTKVFNPFFTTKAIGQGIRLGLSISYGIIRNHFGLIDISSVRGKGTVVRIPLSTLKAKSCWEIKKCADDMRNDCPAFRQNKEHVCWTVGGAYCEVHEQRRGKNWTEVCKQCKVYKSKALAFEASKRGKSSGENE